tara:strand:- start:1194 stop:1583 length:390 start_codon:yes stop_codon:yes gene_type:complete
MNKRILISAAILAIIAIVLGAFGAHKLKELLSVESLNSFETGVRYQMYHVFLLLFLALFSEIKNNTKKIIYRLTIIGTLFFSGSIYLLSTSIITSIDFSSIGFVTPIGGTLLIIAWFFLLRSFINLKAD